MPHTIRPATDSDAPDIRRLSAQLGYPATEDQIRQRLARLIASPNDAVFVAASAEGPLLGWIHGFLSQLLESNYRVEIGGLIVDESCRRQRIGHNLVARLEAWAAERGATEMSVRCRTTRPEAHSFYKTLGYTESKTQIVFRKPLK